MDIDQLISFAERLADAGRMATARVLELNEASRLANFFDFTARDILRLVPPSDEIAERITLIKVAMREAGALTQAAIPDIEANVAIAQQAPAAVLEEAALAGISNELLMAAAAIVADGIPDVQNRIRISDLVRN